MQKRNLFAQLYLFGSRDEAGVRGQLETVFGCTFDPQWAKSDAYGRVTWFSGAFGFEIVFQAMSRRDDGTWYVVTVGTESKLMDLDAPMENIDFHVAQMLRAGGFDQVVDLEEYRSHHLPAGARADRRITA